MTAWIGTFRRLASDVFDGAFGSGPTPELQDEGESDQVRLRRTVWKLQSAYEEASRGESLDQVCSAVASSLRSGRLALLAWLDLLEEIVQLTEQRYGTGSGRGAFKAAQVKAAVRRLLKRSDARSSALVELLGPSAIDLFTGWFIDVTVALLNKNDVLWEASGTTGKVRLPVRTRVLAFLLRVFSRPLAWLEPHDVLDPELYDEVERIATGPGSPFLLLDQILELGEWVVLHREQALALVDLVSTACDEVEYFLDLDGSEAKRGYARDLIIEALEGAGLELGTTARRLAEAVVDVMIDFVVSTNNKRGRYHHGAA